MELTLNTSSLALQSLILLTVENLDYHMEMTKKDHNQLMKLKALLQEKQINLANLHYDRDHARTDSLSKQADNLIIMAELGIRNIKTSIEMIKS